MNRERKAADPDAVPPYGIEIDGVVYPLDGQPPVAHGSAWWPPPRTLATED